MRVLQALLVIARGGGSQLVSVTTDIVVVVMIIIILVIQSGFRPAVVEADARRKGGRIARVGPPALMGVTMRARAWSRVKALRTNVIRTIPSDGRGSVREAGHMNICLH
jgi:hypothetical protein